MRNAVRIITAHIVKRRVRYGALIKRMSSRQDKLTKIQKLVRGHLCRVKNAQKVAKIKRDGMKGTKKWRCAVKIQAVFRGYAFRVKRKRALERLGVKPKE